MDRSLVLLCSVACLTLGPVLGAPPPEDITALLEGVDEVTAPGCIPGPVCVFSDDAFAVLAGRSEGQYVPLAGAAHFGEGRVVAIGHEGLFSASDDRLDNLRWAANVVRWAGGLDAPVVAVQGHGGLAEALAQEGFEVIALDGQRLGEGLDAADVLVIGASSVGEAQLDDLRAFVAEGGGLVASLCPWGWMQVTGLDLRRDLPANVLLAGMGLAFAPGMADRTGRDGYLTDPSNLQLTHAGEALSAMEAHASGSVALSEAELGQVSAVLSTVMRGVPEGESALMPRFRALCASPEAACEPSEDAPVGADRPLARLAATLYLSDAAELPADQVGAHPSAASFPGAVPTDAQRVERVFTVDASVPDWHSMGLYAAPGEVIEVELPVESAGQGLAVRIGCHTDTIWHLNQWKRFPEISRAWPLEETNTRVASPFGGPVYIVCPRSSDLGEVSVTVRGAVEAPLYRRGVTTPEEWTRSLREARAPWAELATDKLVISVASEAVRALDDPERLLSFWDRVMDACADLAAVPRDRERPERYVPDMQISAGYMHSGYPIMTHLDAVDLSVDVDRLLTEGSWGHFHEMGHNHQSGHWTFDGTGEVTVNLFSLYVSETVCDIAGDAHPALDASESQERLRQYLADGADFEAWKGSPFLALTMYQQLQQAFGWQAFIDVFAGYRESPEQALPHNDDQKRDQWMVRFSRQVGRNLGPFFDAWGVPVSGEAKAEIADLPVWMPDNS
ncbi:MAG: M60 family metallopeptidase [Acidobacteriota bacterium]|nr:M60 family metallopeptidase [Acidobacteriota bacterium]